MIFQRPKPKSTPEICSVSQVPEVVYREIGPGRVGGLPGERTGEGRSSTGGEDRGGSVVYRGRGPERVGGLPRERTGEKRVYRGEDRGIQEQQSQSRREAGGLL
ncbi:unnamed protein product [Arctogadus glacialis]